MRLFIASFLVLVGLGLVWLGRSAWQGLGAAAYQGKPLRAWWAQLSTGNAQGKAEAAAAIRALGSNACPGLVRLLQTRDALWRRALWQEAPRLPREAQKLIIADVRDPDAFLTREAAARTLASLGPAARSAVPALAEAVRDPQGRVAAEAADALGKIGGEGAVPALVRDLGESNARVRLNALYALGRIGPPAKAAIPAVAAALADDQIRFMAAYALAGMGTCAVPALVEATLHGEGKARAAAARGFGLFDPRLGPPTESVIQALAAALRDPVLEVRLEAAHSLWIVGSDAGLAAPALTECLRDSSAALREKAALALGAIGSDAAAALPELQRLENDAEPSVRTAASKAMVGIRGR